MRPTDPAPVSITTWTLTMVPLTRRPGMPAIRAACARSTSAPSSGTAGFTRLFLAKSGFARICASASELGVECGRGPSATRMARSHAIASQEAIGIDVHGQAHVAWQLAEIAEPEPQIALQIELSWCLHQQPPAMPTADHGQRRLRRAQHLDPTGSWRPLGQVAGNQRG